MKRRRNPLHATPGQRAGARARNVVLLLCALAAGCARAPRDAESQFISTMRAAAWMDDGEIERACGLLEDVAKAAETSHAWTNVGVARLAAGDASGAEKAWVHALELEPADARAAFLLARRRVQRVQELATVRSTTDGPSRDELIESARQCALTAVAGAAHDATTHALLASIERLRGDSTSAAAAEVQASRLDPERGGSGIDRMQGIQPPHVRLAPGSTRAAPTFAELRLEAIASRVHPADPNEDGQVDLLLEGAREWLLHVQTQGPEIVRWRARLLAPEPVLGLRVLPMGDETRQDVVWWARRTTGKAGVAGVQVSWAFAGEDSLQPRVLVPSTPAWNDVVPLDVDADDDLDLVVATGEAPGLRLWRKQRAAAFEADTSIKAFTAVGAIQRLTAADLDGDGRSDLVAIDAAQRIRVWGAREHDVFVNLDDVAVLDATTVHDIAIVDLDADDDLDVLAASDVGLWVFTNRGTGAFERLAVYRPTHIGWSARSPRGIGVTRMHLVDIDNDGYSDVVTQHVPVWTQVAAATALHEDTAPKLAKASETAAPETVAPEPAPPAPAPGSYLGLWLNDSKGGLRDVSEEAGFDDVSAARSAVTSADLDADGDADLVYAGADGFVRVLWNRCSETARRLQVDFVHQGRNVYPYGASVSVYAGATTRHVSTLGQSVSIGIGTLTHADVVRVVWPDGKAQSALDVSLGEDARIRFER